MYRPFDPWRVVLLLRPIGRLWKCLACSRGDDPDVNPTSALDVYKVMGCSVVTPERCLQNELTVSLLLLFGMIV